MYRVTLREGVPGNSAVRFTSGGLAVSHGQRQGSVKDGPVELGYSWAWCPDGEMPLMTYNAGFINRCAEIPAGVVPATTMNGCTCLAVWDLHDGLCSDGDAVYYGCGMNPPCDGKIVAAQSRAHVLAACSHSS